MILQELMKKFAWEDIKPLLLDICEGRYIDFEFKSIKKSLSLYKKAYEECQAIKPVINKGVIHASPLVVDGTMFEDMEVFYTNGKKNKSQKNIKNYCKYLGKENKKEFLNADVKYAIDFVSRNKVMGMSVDEKDVNTLTEDDFVAYCFFFITMSGVSVSANKKNVREIKKTLKKANDDIDSGKAKFFTMEEVMSNIKNFKK